MSSIIAFLYFSYNFLCPKNEFHIYLTEKPIENMALINTSHLCKGVPLLTTAIRNPVSLQHQWVFQHFNEVRPHCAVLENLLFSMCTVLYINGTDILLSLTDCGKN